MVLQINNLSKYYKGNITAIHDMSCSMGKGIFSVVGPNAAGKTTFLRLLAGVEDPTAGTISVNGLELTHNKQMLRSMMGYLPQTCGFYHSVTGEAMLDYIAVLKGIYDQKMRRYAVDDVIDRVNLKDVQKIKIGDYSFGMKRRLGIAQTLLANPQILILDEPLEGLDQGECNRLGGIIADMADRSVVIMTTHSLQQVECNGSTLLVLRQGRLLYQGTSSELASLADGFVWQVEANGANLDFLKTTTTIVGAQPKDGNAVVRILAPHKPHVTAIPVKAKLEEGYLMLMGTGVHK